jgi:phosphohistidine phosphatase
MRLILVRHAEAYPLGVDGVSTDDKRPLTPKGHSTAKALAEFFKQRAIPFQQIITSGYVRAEETAEPLRLLNPQEIIRIPEFAPEALRPKYVSKLLNELNANTVVVVGHMPNLGQYAKWLLGLRSPLMFEKGAALGLKCKGGVKPDDAELEWYLPPEHFE